MNKHRPVRLHKVEEKSVKAFLTKENTLIVANWVIIAIFMIIFLAVCFMLKPQTYGYL